MGEMRLSTGYLRRLQSQADNELDRRYFAAVAAEIERLRAENERLQALIDAVAKAALTHDGGRAWFAAMTNLYAAATKEDDRGA